MINILEYFDITVRHHFLKTAVIEGEKKITFGDLRTKAESLASYINKFSYHNMPIAVLLPKSIECVIADLAITYSGNIYMNLDVKSPLSRLTNIFNEIKPSMIITSRASIRSDEMPTGFYVFIDQMDLNAEFDAAALNYRREKSIDTDPYCIINTSGSTGTPKGVVLNHRSFIDFTQWAINTKNIEIGENEIVGSLSPSVFDIYSFELCMMMACASIIVIIPESFASFPASLLALMKDSHITFIFWVPAIMVTIANMDLLTHISLPELKTVWFAGEVFPTKQFNYWHRNMHWARFVNLYGPIEITLDCTFFIVDRELRDDEPIPIGSPCRNTDILILDEDRLSEEGELCVRGSSLAAGYYNNPEKTASAFVQNPLNTAYPEVIYRTGDFVCKNAFGELVFKGRKDTLIKHHGYRIELCEIEHVIVNVLKMVERGCAVYNTANKEIVFYYESETDLSDWIPEVRKQIMTALPKYMVPTKFIKQWKLPKNANGKIDRLQLTTLYNEKRK
jgi:amino acid adenylation domain-containing protein